MFNLSEAIQTKIVCQKRTGIHKKYVFLDDDRVVKGPYNQVKIDRINWVSQKLKEWESQFIIHPIETLTSDDGLFITFPNVAQGYPTECETHIESFTGQTMQILKRSGVVKLGDVLTELDWIDPYIPWLTLSLCHLFILSVGDMNLANILVDTEKKLVYIIDYEDQRSAVREDELFYFNKRPAQGKIKIWNQHALPYYNIIAEKLINLLNTETPELQLRINKAIQLLNQFSLQETVPEPVPEKYEVTPSRLGQMEYKGPFGGSTTYSGYPIDVVKSALQKYIRRDEPMKAVMAGFELFRMGELASETPNAKAIQTNLYNRLAVIAAEDIGLANIPLVVPVISEVLLASDNKRRDPSILGAIIQSLSGSEKTRITSHLYRAYAVPEGKEMAKNLGLDIDEAFDDDVNEYYSGNTSELVSDFAKDFWKQDDPMEIRPYLEMFTRRLDQRDPRAITWLDYFMKYIDGKKLKVARRKRRTQPMILVWEILEQHLPNKVSDVLEQAYFKMSEKRPFLMLAVAAILYDAIPEDFTPMDLGPTIQAWVDNQSINQFLYPDPDYSFKLDSFVVDKHTQAGRLLGSTRKDFVEEGARVQPLSENYQDPILEKIYLESN